MRALTELATEIGVRRFVGTAERVGMVGPDGIRGIIQETVAAALAAAAAAAPPPPQAPPAPAPERDDAARFDDQRRDFDEE